MGDLPQASREASNRVKLGSFPKKNPSIAYFCQYQINPVPIRNTGLYCNGILARLLHPTKLPGIFRGT